MQTKYILGLVLSCALVQVSLSECWAEPSADLIVKYKEMEDTFTSRLQNVHQSLMTLLQPALEFPEVQALAAVSPETVGKINASVNFWFNFINQTPTGMLLTKTNMLGVYEGCLRPQIGEITGEIIDTIKIYLDMFMPQAS